MQRQRRQGGAAVVDFVLVVLVVVPLVLGIMQVALVMFVRNTLAAAASEGARYAATADRGPADGEALTRRQVETAISGRYADDITVAPARIGGARAVRVTIKATVPALGLGGPGIALEVSGIAVEEEPW